jgi:hypothetical protein
LLNLILTIAAITMSVLLFASRRSLRGEFGGADADADTYADADAAAKTGFNASPAVSADARNMRALTILLFAAPVVSVLMFFLTQNLDGAMVLKNDWTIGHAVIVAAEAALAVFVLKSEYYEDDMEG